jgi:hypothetical protein
VRDHFYADFDHALGHRIAEDQQRFSAAKLQVADYQQPAGNTRAAKEVIISRFL